MREKQVLLGVLFGRKIEKSKIRRFKALFLMLAYIPTIRIKIIEICLSKFVLRAFYIVEDGRLL